MKWLKRQPGEAVEKDVGRQKVVVKDTGDLSLLLGVVIAEMPVVLIVFG